MVALVGWRGRWRLVVVGGCFKMSSGGEGLRLWENGVGVGRVGG